MLNLHLVSFKKAPESILKHYAHNSFHVNVALTEPRRGYSGWAIPTEQVCIKIQNTAGCL